MTDPTDAPPTRGRGSVPAHRSGGRANGRRRWPRRVLITVNVFVVLALLGAGGAYAYVNYQFDQIKKIHLNSLAGQGSSGTGLNASGAEVPAGAPFTMLVVGSDTRALTGPNNQQFGSAADTAGQRSDTTMLVRVVPATHQLSILSIPRDLWVPIAGMGYQKINAAFDKGPDLLVSTIESQLGIPINHFVEVNFDSFRQITDAVGGIKFYFPTPAKDAYSLLNVPQPGCVNLTGDQALGFVRSREYQYYQHGSWHYEDASDLARIQRQQAFVKKMLKKAQGQYTNPVALNGIINGVTSNLTLDTGFSRNLMLALAKDFRSTDAAGIPNQTLPTYGRTLGDGAQILELQQPQARQMVAAFNNFGVTPPSVAGSSTTAAPGASTSRPSVTVAPSSVSIEVINGSGIAGQAGQATRDLVAAGYRATVTASRAYVPSTTIRYAPDSLPAAQQLAAQITGGATLVADTTLTSTSYNLALTTGNAYGGVTATPGSTASTSTPPTTVANGTTTTTAPPAAPAVYLLPGSQPGQVPPPDC